MPVSIQTRIDAVAGGYLAISGLLAVLFQVPSWGRYAGLHLAGVAAILLIRRAGETPLRGAARFFRCWYPIFLVLPLYREVEVFAAAFGNWGLTPVVQRYEVSLFGGYPAIYLSQRMPWLAVSEYLHLCYWSYVLLVPVLGAWWYASRRMDAFQDLVFLVTTTYFVSYLFFILFPVDSPFYLFERLPEPLSNGPFYKLVHFFSSRAGARGGAFPSAHVSVSTVALVTAWRWQRPAGWMLSPVAAGIYAATVYGRFHYALDVIAGWALAAAVLLTLGRKHPTRGRGSDG